MGIDRMIAQRCYDKDKIYSVVLDTFDDVVEDGTALTCIEIDTESDCWIEIVADETLFGFFHIKAYNRTTLDIHPYIIREKRKYSKQCGKLALNWIKDEAPEMYKKVISQVPSIYPHIKKYTTSLGFDLEGTHTKCFLKHGKLYDLWLFGLSRCDL